MSIADNKLILVMSLINFLRDKTSVTPRQVANHFDIPIKQAISRLQALQFVGVPESSGEPLPDNMISIYSELDRIDPDSALEIWVPESIQGNRLRLSAAEAIALNAGLQYLASVHGIANPELFSLVSQKLSNGSYTKLPTPKVAKSATALALRQRTVQSAITGQYQVSFSYTNSKGEKSNRTVEPIKLMFLNGQTSIRAWCLIRDGLRDFRLDRMADLTQLQKKASHTQENTHLVEDVYQSGEADWELTITANDSLNWLLEQYQATQVAKDLYKIKIAHPHGIKRVIANYAPAITVQDSPEARQTIHDWAAEALQQYRVE